VPVTHPDEQLAAEQQALDRFYARLDELRQDASAALTEWQRLGASGTPQARSERDALAAHYATRLRTLTAAEFGLCFGRIDLVTGEQHHVGRVGLTDADHNTLLVDWRAPAALPFYQATPAAPLGLVRRRHLRLAGRTVVGLDDDLLDVHALTSADHETLSGEAALLAALSRRRSGHMRDIVETIQSEQDRVIRSDAAGVLVVQGGPGTGKTAVALHRAAYLLYTHRERLERSGVLVVAPNNVFLRYIEQVLPSLGEAGVLLATPEQMAPTVAVTGRERDSVARLKGDARMAEVLAAAVLNIKRVPTTQAEIPYGDGELVISRKMALSARRQALAMERPHNIARATFGKQLLRSLMPQASALAVDGDANDRRWLQRDLVGIEELRDAVQEMWPKVSAQEFVVGLLSSPRDLGRAAEGVLSDEETALLLRDPEAPWTPADIPLLDEAYALLGDPEEGRRRAQESERRVAERSYAQKVLEQTGIGEFVDAETLAARFREDPPNSLADRAANDPSATFGHLIVDEAQELSPMMWRLLLRRCPSKSMTVVGDIAQASSAAGATSWASVMDTLAKGRWRQVDLTVNYRTPAEIMAVAADVLESAAPGMAPPTSVRETGVHPAAILVEQADAASLVAATAATAQTELAAVTGGRVAILVPVSRREELAGQLAEQLPELRTDGRPDALDAPVVLVDVQQAKGLEFDAVIVVDPASILADSARGAGDLYVAVTRATQRLTVISGTPLPDILKRLTQPA
jgi:DNA helicase IV